MFATSIGPSGLIPGFLRPETAQGTFLNFKNIINSERLKIPFGIAQIGKVFRNEVTPRNFIFRSREFEQMEIEYFISNEEKIWNDSYKEWIDIRFKWLLTIGIQKNFLDLYKHRSDKLAHYAKACTDITFNFPFGKLELEGIAARGCYDMTQHQKLSKKSLYNNYSSLPHLKSSILKYLLLK